MYGELNDEVFADDLKPALEALEAIKATNTDDLSEPPRLPLKAVEMVPHVFQVRGADVTEHHVGALESTLKAGRDLDAILVWRCGRHSLLVDGHHRLEAYKRQQMANRSSLTIPVEWFRGSAEEAMNAAAKANVPDVLPMTPDQKANLAWRLVLLRRPSHSKAYIATMAGVAERTVANMRKLLKDHGELVSGAETWKAAMAKAQGLGGEWSEEMEEERRMQQVKVWSDRMARTFGNKLSTNTTLAAQVMATHFGRALPGLIRDLMAAADATPEELQAMVDDLLNPEF